MAYNPQAWNDGSGGGTPLSAARLDYMEEGIRAAAAAADGKANASHTHGVTDLTATGTRSSTTFLRGDNTWAAPSGGSSTVAAANITDATATGRSVLTAASQAAARTAIGAAPAGQIVVSGTAPTSPTIGLVWIDNSAAAGGGTTDTTAPTVPTGLTATPSSGQVALTWNASTDNVGVVGYRVRRGGTLLASPTGTSYTDTTVTNGTPYSYTVAAYDAAGNESAQTATVNATPTAAVASLPTVPTNGLLADFASLDAVAASGTVTSWPNRVSGGPALTINGTPQRVGTDASGKPSVIFDGVDDYADAAIGVTARPYTKVIIGRLVTAAVGKTLIGSTNASTNRGVISTASSGGVWNTYGGANLASTVAYDTNKHLLAGVFAGSGACVTVVDGVQTTGTNGTEAGEGLRIGANMSLSQYAHVEVFRVLAYNRALTSTEITDIRAVHQTYYGLP